MTERFSLANKNHLALFVEILFLTGALCPKCAYATRRTSKNWAKCKRCGERVRRRNEREAVSLT